MHKVIQSIFISVICDKYELKCGVVVVGPRYIYAAQRPNTPTKVASATDPHLVGFVFVFVFVFLCFFFIYFELYCKSTCLWELTHCWPFIICILAMMSEMYQFTSLLFQT